MLFDTLDTADCLISKKPVTTETTGFTEARVKPERLVFSFICSAVGLLQSVSSQKSNILHVNWINLPNVLSNYSYQLTNPRKGRRRSQVVI